MINRHSEFCPTEIYRLLREKGVYITQQVGGDNDRDGIVEGTIHRYIIGASK